MLRRRKPSCLRIAAAALILATLSLALPASAVSATRTYVAVNVHCDIATFKLVGLKPATVRAARVTRGQRAARVKPAVVRRGARRGTLRLRLSTLRWTSLRTRTHKPRTATRRDGPRDTRRAHTRRQRCGNTGARTAHVRRKRPKLTVITTADPAPPPPPPPPPSSTCSAQPFCGDFETGNYSQYDQHQWSEGPWADQSTYTINNVGHSECDIVPSPVRQGSFASRCQVKPTTGTSASDRAEMMSSNANATGDASQTQFYGWWTMFPSVNGQPQHWWPTFADHNDFFQFGQNSSAVSPDGNTPGWHYCGVNATQSPARLYCEGPGFPFSSTSQRRKIDLGAIQYDHWYHFVVEARWSQDPSVGYLSLWVDGVNVSPKRSAATLTGTATQVHVSWGLYRAAYSSTNTVIHDGLCRAATYQGAAGC
jgi:Polysaccharide lyase